MPVISQEISHSRFLEKVGAGGMGEVRLAVDVARQAGNSTCAGIMKIREIGTLP